MIFYWQNPFIRRFRPIVQAKPKQQQSRRPGWSRSERFIGSPPLQPLAHIISDQSELALTISAPRSDRILGGLLQPSPVLFHSQPVPLLLRQRDAYFHAAKRDRGLFAPHPTLSVWWAARPGRPKRAGKRVPNHKLEHWLVQTTQQSSISTLE